MQLVLGTDAIRNYKRLSYQPWYALAEFVDNSTQSYFGNRAILDSQFAEDRESLEVRITYDRNQGLLRIADNAMGMDEAELERALRIGAPPADVLGRSQYGLGLKTAACWFGDSWQVITKRLGSDVELEVSVDVERVASGDADLPLRRRSRPAAKHGTVIEISNLHTQLHGRTIGKIREYLTSMYRVDLRDGVAKLYWEGEPLVWDGNLTFLKNSQNRDYYKTFQFLANGKAVTGYIAILGEGSSGRPRAGFSILRRGRVIRGHPDAWRPEAIFGQELGSNNLVNQRITGEVHLDDFEVSHTKDDILWQENEEELVQEQLRAEALDFVEIAKIPRKGIADTRGPADAAVATAIEEMRTELESPQFADSIEFTTIPDEEAIDLAVKPLRDVQDREQPRLSVTIGDLVVATYLSYEQSPNDPYALSETEADRIIAILNMNHPHVATLDNQSFHTYLKHVVFDTVAEWQCRRAQSPISPRSMMMLKDNLLRLPSRIEEDSANE